MKRNFQTKIMQINNQLLPYKEILSEWKNSDLTSESARMLTLKQSEAFEKIVTNEDGWNYFVKVFNQGREVDAWLALDWPDGFDELLLCVPLCTLVKFECSECYVGKRQENNSCANDFSLFGYIAELIKKNDREGLILHIEDVKKILTDENCKWDIKKLKII